MDKTMFNIFLLFITLFYVGCSKKTSENIPRTKVDSCTVKLATAENIDNIKQAYEDTIRSIQYFTDRKMSKDLGLYVFDYNIGKFIKVKSGNTRNVGNEIESWVGTELIGVPDSTEYHQMIGILIDSIHEMSIIAPRREVGKQLIDSLDSLIKYSALYNDSAGTLFVYDGIRDTFADKPLVYSVPNREKYYLVQYIGKMVQPIILYWDNNLQKVNVGYSANVECFIYIDGVIYVDVFCGVPDTDNCAHVYYQIDEGVNVATDFYNVHFVSNEYIGSIIEPVQQEYKLKHLWRR